MVHKRILSHLNEKFVHLPGITLQIREKRQRQNVLNFYGSLSFSAWRFVSILILCTINLVPSYLMNSTSGFVIYLLSNWLCSLYETCGISVFFLATCTIFNSRHDELESNLKQILHMYGIWGLEAIVM